MFFKKDKKQKSSEEVKRHVILKRHAADSIITYAKSCHPNEGILILQGQIKKNNIVVEGLVVPPFASHGPYYSGFPTYDLPFDLSYIGTAHSHPGGSNRPSLQDLNNFYGFISIIISYPYLDGDIGAFDRNGNKVTLDIV